MTGDYASRQEDAILKHIEEVVEKKGEDLVINRQMPNDDVHWHRGYIAAHRDMAVYITKELRRKLNEG